MDILAYVPNMFCLVISHKISKGLLDKWSTLFMSTVMRLIESLRKKFFANFGVKYTLPGRFVQNENW